MGRPSVAETEVTRAIVERSVFAAYPLRSLPEKVGREGRALRFGLRMVRVGKIPG